MTDLFLFRSSPASTIDLASSVNAMAEPAPHSTASKFFPLIARAASCWIALKLGGKGDEDAGFNPVNALPETNFPSLNACRKLWTNEVTGSGIKRFASEICWFAHVYAVKYVTPPLGSVKAWHPSRVPYPNAFYFLVAKHVHFLNSEWNRYVIVIPLFVWNPNSGIPAIQLHPHTPNRAKNTTQDQKRNIIFL